MTVTIPVWMLWAIAGCCFVSAGLSAWQWIETRRWRRSIRDNFIKNHRG